MGAALDIKHGVYEPVTIKSEQETKIENRWYNREGNKYGAKAGKDYNILHDYRSYNYVITLAALPLQKYKDPDYFTTNPDLDFVILKSSGKAGRATGIDLETYLSLNDNTDPTLLEKTSEVQEILEEYNSTGAGRLDLFIDNLEISQSWNMITGSVPGQIRFDVIEPWSVNGFIEAIRINAMAAGYLDHRSATFVLKVEFIGYKQDSQSAQVVPLATRHFPIAINQVGIETTEKGTVYRVACAPKNAGGLGEEGKLATTIKMKGATVGEVLESLAEQLTESRKSDLGNKEEVAFNTYKIQFLDENGDLVRSDESTIGKCKINEYLRDNQIFDWPTPADENPKSSYRGPENAKNRKYDPTKETVAFGSQHSILDVIAAVIRDSTYTKQLLDTLEETKKNNAGLINWFRIYLSDIPKEKVNNKSGNETYTYVYNIRPYKFHYTRLPGQGRTMFDGDELRGQIARTYQYLYSGQNIDVLKFDLKLNNLYNQVRPYRFGEKDISGTSQAAGASEATKFSESENKKDPTKEDQQNIPVVALTRANDQQIFGPQGNAPQASPYQLLGKLIHETLLDSPDFYMLDLNIVGDPYYLCTAAMGNQEEKIDPSTPAITNEGSAPYLSGNVFIDIWFKNPKDIKPNGWADFGEAILPFSGIYQVQQIRNTFREGRFEQQLKGVRLPGQIVNDSGVIQVTPPKQEVKEGESKTVDTAPGSVQQSGSRPSTASVINMLSRGLPTNGLPGILSNFTNAVGGALGGLQTSLQTTLSRVDQGLANALAPVNAVLQASAGVVTFAAQVGGLVAAGQALVNGFDTGAGGVPGIGQKVGGYNPYTSGLRLDVNGLQNLTNNQGNSNQANLEIQTKVVSTFVQDNRNLNILKENFYKNDYSLRTTPGDRSLNNSGNNIDALIGSTKIDPKAVAQSFGIDPAQLSGMSSDQQSNLINKLIGLASKIPENTDIAGLKALGISLANIPGYRLPNLPALQPLTTAPLANVPVIDLQKILASGGNPANLPGATSIPAVASLLALINKDKGVPNNGITGGQGPFNATNVFDKLETAENLSVQLSKQNGSVEANVANINYRLQGYSGYYQVTETAFSKYGTRRTESPIDRLMQTKV